MFRRRPPAAAVGTYTSWSWPPRDGGYREMAWELEPRSDPSPAGYFWSHQVALLGGEAAYCGLQTMGSEPSGKIAIFSVWEAIDADGPEYVAAFSGEGSGMSVRIRYPWVPGRRERLAISSGDDGWWEAKVGDLSMGRIRARPEWGGLAASSIMWTERYGPPIRDCRELGRSVAWFGPPTADDGTRPTGHQNFLGAGPGCPGSAARDADGGGVVHIVGG